MHAGGITERALIHIRFAHITLFAIFKVFLQTKRGALELRL